MTVVIIHFVSPPQPTISASTNTSAEIQNDISPVDYSQISSWHLLGQSEALNNETKTETSATLELKLRGIFYLGEQRRAYAIIEASDQTQKSYHINDALPGGGILQAIENDRVVILANNQATTLPLTKIETTPDTAETSPQ
jgi:type II secretory pathway component PulC